MASEVDDLRGHYDRYRAVTLEHLQRLSDEQLLWRPRPDAFNCAQHFVHLAQTEDFYMRGLFGQDWNTERLRLPKRLPNKADLQGEFETVRKLTLNAFSTLRPKRLNAVVQFGVPLGMVPSLVAVAGVGARNPPQGAAR
jgi:uncharacterized damage-inducible protein DinB